MFNKFVPGRLGRGITLLTFLAYVTGLCAEQVVFTEVMYNPVGTKPEYIEVYNQTSTPFDIAGWRFSSGVEFVLPPFDESAPERSFLSAFERVVFSSAAEDETRAAYGIPEQVRVFGPWSGRLDNAGERIVLEDKNGVVVCALEYDDSGDWLIAADGKGHSLVVKNPNKPIDDWRNWDFSRRKNGSPGFEPVAQAETRVSSPEVNLNEGVVFVDYDQVWKYNDRAVDLGEEWHEPDYDAGDWESGPGLLGFEDSGLPWPGLQTVLDRNQDGANGSTITFYFRTEFDFHGEPSEAVITVDQILDDGAVYYLNGEELFRS
ncbi:MAG: lamin tail domain-containing protein, partial [Verrucomicrobia bacterium]|nr:lamin tail domain-containing protein [Verrucomicrobiota bacterium]